MSVLTHPGLTTTQTMPRGPRSIAALRITTTGDVVEKGFEDTQRTHRIHIENTGPRCVVDIARPLP